MAATLTAEEEVAMDSGSRGQWTRCCSLVTLKPGTTPKVKNEVNFLVLDNRYT